EVVAAALDLLGPDLDDPLEHLLRAASAPEDLERDDAEVLEALPRDPPLLASRLRRPECELDVRHGHATLAPREDVPPPPDAAPERDEALAREERDDRVERPHPEDLESEPQAAEAALRPP